MRNLGVCVLGEYFEFLLREASWFLPGRLCIKRITHSSFIDGTGDVLSQFVHAQKGRSNAGNDMLLAA